MAKDAASQTPGTTRAMERIVDPLLDELVTEAPAVMLTGSWAGTVPGQLG